ncbi:Lrp/AsnC family transcriptional regulator [Afifella pfennigii]|uniref:Lrp/AsnC family transcriptional regulator n=1 Tax=Afifella pfennigii TaxID=209897 RepID=UPI0004795D97|nr:Lrp/AsnC family transcriptional regulator [Afifella pfennigii]
MTGTKLDRIDLRILETLQRDARITKARLAEAVNLSPSACWERLKRLEEAGVIAGYHARIDARKLGPAALVMVEVALRGHRQIDFERFEAAVLKVPEIVECQATGGGVDYLLKVVTPDIDAYQRLIDGLLERDLGIERYYSYIVTKSVKESAGLPLARLTGGG